mmetsp:Transcript_14726/g.44290  ORF Transcript_14726/g.44290 Transcript_14726/m.44290 type:complete len:253 (-) Transcript_14726:13-771(-)
MARTRIRGQNPYLKRTMLFSARSATPRHTSNVGEENLKGSFRRRHKRSLPAPSLAPCSPRGRCGRRMTPLYMERAMILTRWYPNLVCTGPRTAPMSLPSSKTTSSNSETIMPGLKLPRSPPRFFDGQVEYCIAMSPKSAPSSIWRLMSRHCSSVLTSTCEARATVPGGGAVNCLFSKAPSMTFLKPSKNPMDIGARRIERARDTGGAKAAATPRKSAKRKVRSMVPGRVNTARTTQSLRQRRRCPLREPNEN